MSRLVCQAKPSHYLEHSGSRCNRGGLQFYISSKCVREIKVSCLRSQKMAGHEVELVWYLKLNWRLHSQVTLRQECAGVIWEGLSFLFDVNFFKAGLILTMLPKPPSLPSHTQRVYCSCTQCTLNKTPNQMQQPLLHKPWLECSFLKPLGQ